MSWWAILPSMRETQNHTEVYYSPIRMATGKKTDNATCWQGCGANITLSVKFSCRWKQKIIQPLWKTVWHFLTKLNIHLPNDAAIALLCIYPREKKTSVHTKTCTQMYMAAVFITQSWKQLKCPTTGECIISKCGGAIIWIE